MKIIVRMPNWIGDVVMATPVLADLRDHFKEAEITAMCQLPGAELLREDPAIDQLFSFKRQPNEFARRRDQKFIEKLRTGQYDLGILLTHSLSSLWWFWQGRVQRRVGFDGFLRTFLLTDRVKRPKEKGHQVEYYKTLLVPLGIPISSTKPRLYISEKEITDSKKLLFQQGYQKGQPLIGIHPGAAYGSAKCWPRERFRALTKRLLERDPHVAIVFFGDTAAAGLIQEICRGLPDQVIDLAGVTTLRELASLIKDCDLLITNDSGPMHIADAFGTPLVALFGSTDDTSTGPYSQKEAVINKRVACSPCFKRVCPIDFRCMDQISVDEVLEKALAHRKNRRSRV